METKFASVAMIIADTWRNNPYGGPWVKEDETNCSKKVPASPGKFLKILIELCQLFGYYCPRTQAGREVIKANSDAMGHDPQES